MATRGKSALLAILQSLIVLAQVGLSIAIIAVVRRELWFQVVGPSTTCYRTWFGAIWCVGDWVCLMSTSSANICSYTWSVCAFSLFLSLMIMFALSCSGRRYGRGCYTTLVFSALIGLAWWIAAGVVTTVNAQNADNEGFAMEASKYRTAVYGMAWAQMSLFFCSTVLAVITCCQAPAAPDHEQSAYPQGAYNSSAYAQPGYQQPPAYGVPPSYNPGYGNPPPPMAYPPPGNYQYGTPAYPQQPAATGSYAAPPPYPPPPTAEEWKQQQQQGQQ